MGRDAAYLDGNNQAGGIELRTPTIAPVVQKRCQKRERCESKQFAILDFSIATTNNHIMCRTHF
jgi:hypothetical protein